MIIQVWAAGKPMQSLSLEPPLSGTYQGHKQELNEQCCPG